jgi:hypothetical protein
LVYQRDQVRRLSSIHCHRRWRRCCA